MRDVDGLTAPYTALWLPLATPNEGAAVWLWRALRPPPSGTLTATAPPTDGSWVPVERDREGELLPVLWGQLATIWEPAAPTAGEPHAWTRPADLAQVAACPVLLAFGTPASALGPRTDRKSTRLNSSHL